MVRPAMRSEPPGYTEATSILGIPPYFLLLGIAFLFASSDACLMQFYRRDLPHLQRDFKPHFITFVTEARMQLPDWARQLAMASCRHDHRKKYELYVAVVMPDHVHLILTPAVDHQRQEIYSLIAIMRGIKAASARAINQHWNRHGRVWQDESFDHVLRASEQLDAKIQYVLENPVRTGLVTDWRKYPWVWQRQDQPVAEMIVRQI